MPAVSRYGPIRTGRGTGHEKALRFGRREAPIRCGFARTYVPSGDRRVGHTETPPSSAHYRPTTGGWLGGARNPVGGGERGAVEDVRLADFDLVEVEAAHRFEQNDGPGDDAGRPVGMEPGHSSAGVHGQRGELGDDALARASPEAVAVDFLRVVGIELLGDGGERGGGPGDGDALLDAFADFPGHRLAHDGPGVLGERRHLVGARWVVVEVALGVAHRSHACGGVEAGVAAGPAGDVFGAASADVDHERVGAGLAVGGGAEEGEPGLLVAGDRASVDAEAVADLLAEGGAVLGIAHGASGDADDLVGAEPVEHFAVDGEGLADAGDGCVGEPAGGLYALADPRTVHSPACSACRNSGRRRARPSGRTRWPTSSCSTTTETRFGWAICGGASRWGSRGGATPGARAAGA